MSDAASTRRVDAHAEDAVRWDPPATLPGRDAWMWAGPASVTARWRSCKPTETASLGALADTTAP